MNHSLTNPEHWDETWQHAPRMRLPSPWRVSTRNRMRLLRNDVKPGMNVLEIGCAPGKLLAYVAGPLQARVSGLDASVVGLQWTRRLFDSLGFHADLRCEDVFASTFQRGSFDIVHSAGLIEHFTDPTEIIKIHLDLVRPGGIVLISIPCLRGLLGSIAIFFDEENVRIHNLRIMDCDALAAAVPATPPALITTYRFGRFSLDAVHFEAKLPPPLAGAARLISNLAGLLQWADIRSICPDLILRIVRA